jgi:anti-sigma B factor antagonist
VSVVERDGWGVTTGEDGRARALRDSRLRAPDVVAGCDVRVRRRGAWTIVELEGELDLAGSDAVRKLLVQIPAARGLGLALDLRGLCFIDSTGIRLLLQALRHADERGAEFALIRGGYAIQRVLQLVGLTDQLRIVDDPAQLDADG